MNEYTVTVGYCVVCMCIGAGLALAMRVQAGRRR